MLLPSKIMIMYLIFLKSRFWPIFRQIQHFQNFWFFDKIEHQYWKIVVYNGKGELVLSPHREKIKLLIICFGVETVNFIWISEDFRKFI